MNIIRDKIQNIVIDDELSAALGTFDGIHLGHQRLINSAVDFAHKNGYKSAVITFDRVPISLIRPEMFKGTVSSDLVRETIIESLGVDYMIVLTFDNEFADLTSEEFINIICTKFKVKNIVCGYNYTFGKGGTGTAELIQSMARTMSYNAQIVNPIKVNDEVVSSTKIRKYLSEGNLDKANEMLGYTYFYKNKVEHGKGLANKLGFPTANLCISDEISIKDGVYVSDTIIDNVAYRSVTNIGYCPTFNGKKRVVETFLLNFHENLYSNEIIIRFIKFIRSETKFSSPKMLQERVSLDIEIASKYKN